jgi:hypothetical protein
LNWLAKPYSLYQGVFYSTLKLFGTTSLASGLLNQIIKIVFSLGKKPSTEYMNALKQAESYSETMYMSKKGIYDQLTSDYGGQFPDDAAQYAIANVQADWNANALEKAKTYQSTMSMSKNAIYNQLISNFGEKFTKEQAQYGYFCPAPRNSLLVFQSFVPDFICK